MPVSPSNRLCRESERRIGARLPVPVSARLDVLVAIGNDAWAPTSRKEALSAVLLALKPGRLRAILESFRNARVADAYVSPWPDWRFLYPPGSPGPHKQLSLLKEFEQPDELPACTPDELLAEAADYRIGLEIAWPLVTRTDLLVTVANEAQLETSRQEVIAAAVLAAPADSKWLARRLHSYWHAPVAAAAVPGFPVELVLDPPTSHGRASRTHRRISRSPRTGPPPDVPRRRAGHTGPRPT
jgi:hypothetical protein